MVKRAVNGIEIAPPALVPVIEVMDAEPEYEPPELVLLRAKVGLEQ